jgi:hypothetical protein
MKKDKTKSKDKKVVPVKKENICDHYGECDVFYPCFGTRHCLLAKEGK